MPLSDEAEARLFGTSSGLASTGGISLVNDLDPAGPTESKQSRSPSSGRADGNLDGAMCMRELVTGTSLQTGKPLSGNRLKQSLQVNISMKAVRASADLGGRPALIVNGRDDAILAPNHTSRAYFGANQLAEGEQSQLSYVEVTNAHHLDNLNGIPGFAERYIPLNYYYHGALTSVYDRLTKGTPLPRSQVIHAIPRGLNAAGKANPLNRDHLPLPSQDPSHPIEMVNGALRIPE